jgi:hypothetical protein
MNIPKQVLKLNLNYKLNKPKITIMSIAILVTLAASPLLLVNYDSQAQAQAQTTAATLTTEAAQTQTRQVTGRGDSITFTCPNGQPPPASLGQHVNDALEFSATQQNNQVTGTWDISLSTCVYIFTNIVHEISST